MRQYFDAKRQHRDAIVFFRMGDFYEMFYEDALTASRALDLTLTSRSKDAEGHNIPMCGIPHHAADGYLTRLVRKGYRVAICEQVEDPRKAKGLVKREVVRVVSPGTLTDAGYLDAREPAFLMAIVASDRDDAIARRLPPSGTIGVALLDLSTGEFSATEYAGDDGLQALADELKVLKPREIVAAGDGNGSGGARLPPIAVNGLPVTPLEPWAFELESARRTLLDQLRAGGLEGFGLDRHPAAVAAAGGLVHYLRESHELDRTVTSMGSRMLRSWLLRPLVALEPIRDRLDAVEELAFRTTDRGKFRETLKAVQDLERLIARVALGTAGPRDLVGLKHSLGVVPRVRTVLADLQAPL